MVDREKRDLAKRLVERFLSCEITNDEFNDGFPTDERDRALEAIYSNLWFYYDDRYTHKLEKKYELKPEAKDLFKRCAAFLGSDLEYEWPPYKWIDPGYLLLRLLGQSKRIHKRFEKFKTHGDFSVWPFIREPDYIRFAPDAR